ncbi:MAG: bifunctional ADP-heptose synthase (sugar kinase/adenylyltransferase) [Planctomycetota bacterium]|jgi:bifunctional ADP-heptose synthase (sugar kinase/adenylyltransferase)
MNASNDQNLDGTKRVNSFNSEFSNSVRAFANELGTKYRTSDISSLLDRMKSLRVLVIGDTILDDYHFCRTLGTSSKDPALAVQHESSEMFAGGVLAVANHIANLSDNVRLLSVVGERDSHREFIQSKLNPKVSREFVTKPGAPTTLKRRFVDSYFVNKLFEVYVMDDAPLADKEEGEFRALVSRELEECDLVVAADFGHGTISSKLRDELCNSSCFLAVNTQANAGNRGFHTIGSYSRADFASLSEGEIRLEFRDPRGDLSPMLESVSERLRTRAFVVTRGQNGCIVRAGDGSTFRVPSFTPRIVDRVGAGDALFAISSLAARLETPPDLLGFLGNVVGGLAVEVLGNRESIDRSNIEEFIEPLLG